MSFKKPTKRIAGREEKESDKEIESKKKDAKNQKNGWAVDATAGEARDGMKESNRDGFETRVSADGVKRAGRNVTGKITTKKRKLIVKPQRKIAAVAPHERGASQEQEIAENA